MAHRTFFWFIAPSLLAMMLFIALPIVSVIIQSLHIEHEKVVIAVENCGPFGCTKSTTVDTAATAALIEAEPWGQWNGLDTYTNRAHLAFSEIGAAWSSSNGIGDFFGKVMNLPFYSALAFTLAYTFIVTPFTIVLGFSIAIAVNTVSQWLKGPVIFFSLLPMIVTPLIGSLILFWMVDARGILGASIQGLFNDPTLSLKASPVLTWIMLMVYGIWSSAPFAFVIYYAGLQTVPQDTVESAMIDGATRWERIRYVVIPTPAAAYHICGAYPADGQFPGAGAYRRFQRRGVRHITRLYRLQRSAGRDSAVLIRGSHFGADDSWRRHPSHASAHPHMARLQPQDVRAR